MTLAEACDPLFQYICRLNRSARRGVSLELNTVRGEIGGLFDEMRRSSSSAGQEEAYEKVRLPLMYFVDYMIKESTLDFARQWEELAHAEDKFAGDEDFFDLLDETLADQSQQAVDRLEVFYTCIGLGMVGFYVGQPEFLRKKMMEISSRLRGRIDADETARICPDAYEHVNTANLVPNTGRSLARIFVVLIVLVVVLIVGNVVLYKQSSSELIQALKRLSDDGAATANREG